LSKRVEALANSSVTQHGHFGSFSTGKGETCRGALVFAPGLVVWFGEVGHVEGLFGLGTDKALASGIRDVGGGCGFTNVEGLLTLRDQCLTVTVVSDKSSASISLSLSSSIRIKTLTVVLQVAPRTFSITIRISAVVVVLIETGIISVRIVRIPSLAFSLLVLILTIPTRSQSFILETIIV